MKVLVISHNVFCDTTSMGKTLSGYFRCWQTNELAQLYIHSEIPTSHICENYYRITDKEAFVSIFSRQTGHVYHVEDIKKERVGSRTDVGMEARIYQKARKRTPLVYLLRNTVWRLSAWKTSRLLNWVDDFDPDVVFFASGDYAFLYRIALEISRYKQVPLIVSCMDDYYFYNKNSKKVFGKFVHWMYMKQVKKTLDYSSFLFTICDKMTVDYAKTFKKKCFTLNTSCSFEGPFGEVKESCISYLGNLGHKRYEQLIALGKALRKLELKEGPNWIDVYSSESRTEILSKLTKENGICFHGQVGSEEVRSIIGKSLAVIHTEAFDEEVRQSVRYSVSTKIADSLMSGTCIIAFGPDDVASIEYLKKNNAAYVISSHETLEVQLERILTDENLRKSIEANALMLAKRNHGIGNNATYVLETITENM